MAGYAKLFSSITSSSLWSSSKDAKILFVTMLAMADETGFVEAAPSGLARAAGLSLDDVRDALQILTAPDPESRSQVADGRRIAVVPRGYCIVTYEEYRARGLDGDERREYMRQYMREYRARSAVNTESTVAGKQPVNSVSKCKQKLESASAASDAETEADQKKPSPASPVEFDFEAVYALYPRKEGRKKGLQRCRSQIKTREKYDALLRAVKNYAAIASPGYEKHFDTFMGCWEDYADAGLLTPRRPDQPPRATGHAKPAPHNTETKEYEL